jgi:hypothetical protein
MDKPSRRNVLMAGGTLGALGALGVASPAQARPAWTWSPEGSVAGRGQGADPRWVWDPEADDLVASLLDRGDVPRVNELLRTWTRLSNSGLAVHRAHHRALRAYLRGESAGPVMDQALTIAAESKAGRPDYPGPPTRLLSRIVAGDREAFTAELVNTLEEFRDHYSVAFRKDDADGLVNIDVLALVCHAHRELGWEVLVTSPYLPTAIIETAR